MSRGHNFCNCINLLSHIAKNFVANITFCSKGVQKTGEVHKFVPVLKMLCPESHFSLKEKKLLRVAWKKCLGAGKFEGWTTILFHSVEKNVTRITLLTDKAEHFVARFTILSHSINSFVTIITTWLHCIQMLVRRSAVSSHSA